MRITVELSETLALLGGEAIGARVAITDDVGPDESRDGAYARLRTVALEFVSDAVGHMVPPTHPRATPERREQEEQRRRDMEQARRRAHTTRRDAIVAWRRARDEAAAAGDDVPPHPDTLPAEVRGYTDDVIDGA